MELGEIQDHVIEEHLDVDSPDSRLEDGAEELGPNIKPPQPKLKKDKHHKHRHKHDRRRDSDKSRRKRSREKLTEDYYKDRSKDRGKRYGSEDRDVKERDRGNREEDYRRREKSIKERERLEKLEMERRRLERERRRIERERFQRVADEKRERDRYSRSAAPGRDQSYDRASADSSRDRRHRDSSRSPVRQSESKPLAKYSEWPKETHLSAEEEEHEAEWAEQKLELGSSQERVPAHELESMDEGHVSEGKEQSSEGSSSSSSSDDSSSDSDSSSSEEGKKEKQADQHLRSKFDSGSEKNVSDDDNPAAMKRRNSASDESDIPGTPPESPVELLPDLPPYFPAIQGCRNVEEFHCLNRIEEGTYGVVYRARDKKTNEIVALKRLKMEKEKEGFPITSLREINTLLKAQHPNIVTVREIVVGSNMDRIYIVMDYVEHDLKSLMEVMKEPFMIGEVKCLLKQLLRGVQHLHDNWIVHRDLKTSNLLFSHQGILKIGDFGLAREYGSPLKPYTPIVVTLWYRAPELLLGIKEYSTHIDMWSVGCIMAEFLTRKPLFPGKSEIDELGRIFKDLGTPNEKIWPGVSDLKGWKSCNFAQYPYNSLRNRFDSLLSDKGFDLLNRFLTYDPTRRIPADGALVHEWFKETPLPIDPSMFPTWPAKSEQNVKRTHGNSPKPPSGGKAYSKLLGDDDENLSGFHLPQAPRGVSAVSTFSLKF